VGERGGEGAISYGNRVGIKKVVGVPLGRRKKRDGWYTVYFRLKQEFLTRKKKGVIVPDPP